MKKCMLFTTLLILSIQLSAQSPHYSIHLDFQTLSLKADNHFHDTRNVLFIDSSTITLSDAVAEYKYDFKPEFGINGGIQLHVPINKSVNLVTGFELSYQRFTSAQEQVAITNLFTNVDTFQLNPSQPPSLENSCDVYTNSVLDVVDNYDISNTILFLKIPFLLESRIWQNRLNVQLGGYIATPLASSVSKPWYREEMTNTTDVSGNEITECTFHPITNKDKSGSGFKNFIPGIQVNLAYLIWKNISVEIGLSQTWGSYYSGRNQFFYLPEGGIETKATQISAGLRIDLEKND